MFLNKLYLQLRTEEERLRERFEFLDSQYYQGRYGLLIEILDAIEIHRRLESEQDE